MKPLARKQDETLPQVSVIIPVRNSERYLPFAIDSVLATGYSPIEIIAVDGGSVDGTAEIIRSFPSVRHIHQEGRGLADAWNTGIRASGGEFIAFLDSDDVWAPEKLERQVACLVDNPDVQYTIARVKFFLESGFSVPEGFKKNLFEGDHVGRIPGTLLVRRSLFDRVGLFDVNLTIAADVDWFARVKDDRTEMLILPDLLLFKRIHGTNLSSNAEKNSRELLCLLKRSIDRRK